MAVQVAMPLDEVTFEHACAAAAARGMTVEACGTDLVRQLLPPAQPADIAQDKLIGEAAQKGHDSRTRS